MILTLSAFLSLLGFNFVSGADLVTRGEAPYHASVICRDPFWGFIGNCFSGAIISERHVLVTGDITYEDIENILHVRVGTTNISDLYGHIRAVKSVTIHPERFTFRQYMGNQDFPPRNNLAIVEVTEPFLFNFTVQPIPLPSSNNEAISQHGILTDWNGGNGLEKVSMPLLQSREECSQHYGIYKISEEAFCGAELDEDGNAIDIAVDFNVGSILACNGTDGNIYLCGIYNLEPILNTLCDGPETRPEGWPTYPIAFTDISKHLDWINQTISGAKSVKKIPVPERPMPISAENHEFPYQVSIHMYDYQIEEYVFEGSGVILDEYHILTNTFMAPARIYSYKIVAGGNDYTGIGMQSTNLTEIFWNPDYCYVQVDMKVNNLGILRVKDPFVFGDFVKPISLPSENDTATAAGNATISAWFIEGSSLLQKIEMPVISGDECFKYYGKYKWRSGRICTGFPFGDGALDGDYGFIDGFPAVCKNDEGEDHLCGVHSIMSHVVMMNDDFLGGYPIVFSDVKKHLPWIKYAMSRP